VDREVRAVVAFKSSSAYLPSAFGISPQGPLAPPPSGLFRFMKRCLIACQRTVETDHSVGLRGGARNTRRKDEAFA
jgi:hypothetical protein